MKVIHTAPWVGRRRLVWLCCFLAVLVGVSGLGFFLSQREEIGPVMKTQTVSKVKGVWLNYMEYAAMINGCSLSEYEENLEVLFDNLQSAGLNTLFVHLRSHSDSLYPSVLFPWSKHINGGAGVDYDPLECLITKAHQYKIQVHGWVNPYRISSGTLAELDKNHPAVLLNQKEKNSVVETDIGVYYNPASPSARSLVLAGVKEIVENYQVDGIQYDDYFYPTTMETFDKESYQKYCQGATYPLSLADWRRTQVNLLIAGTYQITKAYEGIAFGVSPAAGIDKNYSSLYADVSAWVQGGYVDYICPQLYFGFSYPSEDFRFDRLVQQWETLAGEVPLYIGLASYKVGKEDAGSNEWVTATDLLARETRFVKGIEAVEGVCLYHYSSLFQENEQSAKELFYLKEALKDF